MDKKEGFTIDPDWKNVISKKQAVYLSWFQRLLCRWFNIIPEKKYWYDIIITVNDPGPVSIGNILISSVRDLWHVYDVTYEEGLHRIKIKSIEPLLHYRLYGKMGLLCSTFAERQKV